MIYLTPREQACLDVLVEYSRSGIGPTFDEIRIALGLSSKSGVARLVGQLERKGMIRRRYNRSCAIEVVPQRRAVFRWPESRRPMFGKAYASNFTVVTGRDAWGSFLCWYANEYRVPAADLRLEVKRG